MIRALIRDRRGDAVTDVRNFKSQSELDHYVQSVSEELGRRGQRVDVLPPSELTEAQLAQLEHLRKLATQANGLMKHFVVDADMNRRWRNRTPTAGDVELFRQSIIEAADQFKELALAEFGCDRRQEVA